MHFWRLAAFVAPFGRFFHDLGRSSLDFGAPSWPYVGTHFALDGIFRHAAGIAAKKPCWHSLSAFRFHYAARRYVRSTWNSPFWPHKSFSQRLFWRFKLKAFKKYRLGRLQARFWSPQARFLRPRSSIWTGSGTFFLRFVARMPREPRTPRTPAKTKPRSQMRQERVGGGAPPPKGFQWNWSQVRHFSTLQQNHFYPLKLNVFQK